MAKRLMDRVREAIRARHYSWKTEQSYVHWIRRRYPHRPAIAWALGRAHDNDLHPCDQSRRPGRAQSAGYCLMVKSRPRYRSAGAEAAR